MKLSLRATVASVQMFDAIARHTSSWGTVLLSLAMVAGCVSTTSSISAKEADHAGMEHGMKQGGQQPSGMDHSGATHGSMSHPPLMVPKGQVVPTLKLTVEPDAIRGWNLHAAVSNFSFAPERVNQSSLATEGHAHLLINGEKITRLYGPWYYIPELPPGEHEIRVELNTNHHEALMSEKGAIADTVKVTVSPKQ